MDSTAAVTRPCPRPRPAALLAAALLALGCASAGYGTDDAPIFDGRPATSWSLPPQCAVPLPRGADRSRGLPAVRCAQAALNGMGYACGPTDGIAGKGTRACLRQFQRDRGLPVTGILDTASKAAIGC